MRLMMAALVAAALALAGCGGDNHSHGNNASNHSHDDHDHHAHGDAHPMGEHTFEGGYAVKASQMGKVEAGKEAAFEVTVLKDGKPFKAANMTAWLADKDGGNAGRVSGGEWMDKEELWDVHLDTPAKLDGMMLWVRLRDAGKDMRHAFALAKD
ncbi:MAG: hypothetical protein KF696_11675 [Planctomycetes bacterium]|nr:hypothetical protein [Planctomycetota bacterium]MCW8135253.1 hypothetical protein [Planctomycetota bacterium]